MWAWPRGVIRRVKRLGLVGGVGSWWKRLSRGQGRLLVGKGLEGEGLRDAAGLTLQGWGEGGQEGNGQGVDGGVG